MDEGRKEGGRDGKGRKDTGNEAEGEEGGGTFDGAWGGEAPK